MTPRPREHEFHCLHCGAQVMTASCISGVNNRNHCPFCLWSRHLDWAMAGDRLSACKAKMRPWGLTMKPGRDKYSTSGGELMLVHSCTACDRLSINRIAADDDSESLMEVFFASTGLTSTQRFQLEINGIKILDERNIGILQEQLQGQKIVHLII